MASPQMIQEGWAGEFVPTRWASFLPEAGEKKFLYSLLLPVLPVLSWLQCEIRDLLLLEVGPTKGDFAAAMLEVGLASIFFDPNHGPEMDVSHPFGYTNALSLAMRVMCGGTCLFALSRDTWVQGWLFDSGRSSSNPAGDEGSADGRRANDFVTKCVVLSLIMWLRGVSGGPHIS